MQAIDLIGGLIIGAFAGAFLWEMLVGAPKLRASQRREHRLEDRIGTWQSMAIIAWEERDRTHDALDAIYDGNDRHSVKVPDMRVVQ